MNTSIATFLYMLAVLDVYEIKHGLSVILHNFQCWRKFANLFYLLM